MKLGLTSDTPAARWCAMSEIKDELEKYERDVFPKYNGKVPFDLWVCFRCLPKEYGRKSLRRFYKADNALGVDISIDEELIRPKINGSFKPLTKDEQRLLMGIIFYSFLEETLKKYNDKLPELEKHGTEFLKDTKSWLLKNYWLKVG